MQNAGSFSILLLSCLEVTIHVDSDKYARGEKGAMSLFRWSECVCVYVVRGTVIYTYIYMPVCLCVCMNAHFAAKWEEN